MEDLNKFASNQLANAGWFDPVVDQATEKNKIALVVMDLVRAYQANWIDKDPRHIQTITHLFTKLIKGEKLGGFIYG